MDIVEPSRSLGAATRLLADFEDAVILKTVGEVNIGLLSVDDVERDVERAVVTDVWRSSPLSAARRVGQPGMPTRAADARTES
jgi:hypothetical protein